MITSLSYSGLKLYETCPRKFKYVYVDKLPDPSGPAAVRGTKLHNSVERVLKRETEQLDEELAGVKPIFDMWVDKHAESEVPFALDSALCPVVFESDSRVFRGIIDVIITEESTATVIDIKTGKIRDYADQLKAYATALFLCRPDIQEIKTAILFVDHNQLTYGVTYTRTQLEALKLWLLGKLQVVKSDNVFAPNPSYLCQFCNFSQKKGGSCKW